MFVILRSALFLHTKLFFFFKNFTWYYRKGGGEEISKSSLGDSIIAQKPLVLQNTSISVLLIYNFYHALSSCEFTHLFFSFSNLFSKCLLSACCVPGTVLGARYKYLPLWRLLHSGWRRQIISKQMYNMSDAAKSYGRN